MSVKMFFINRDDDEPFREEVFLLTINDFVIKDLQYKSVMSIKNISTNTFSSFPMCCVTDSIDNICYYDAKGKLLTRPILDENTVIRLEPKESAFIPTGCYFDLLVDTVSGIFSEPKESLQLKLDQAGAVGIVGIDYERNVFLLVYNGTTEAVDIKNNLFLSTATVEVWEEPSFIVCASNLKKLADIL